jgi:hypothetical protein
MGFSTVNSLYPAYSTISVVALGQIRLHQLIIHNHLEKSTTQPRAAKAFHREHWEEVGNACETLSTWNEARNGYIGAYSRTRTSALRDESVTLVNLVWPIQQQYELYTWR